MKRFSFTLQSILSLKEKIEENEKLKLYALKSELSALTNEFEELNSIYLSYSLERRKTSEQGIQISSHLSIYHFIGFLMLLLVVLSRQNPHK